MIRITNKHLGWLIIIVILFIPWFPVVFGNIPAFPNNPHDFSWLETLRGVETMIVCLISVLGALYGIGRLLSDDLFGFTIKLPRKMVPDNKRDRELFLKLGKLDQHDPEWHRIYNELNSRGRWG